MDNDSRKYAIGFAATAAHWACIRSPMFKCVNELKEEYLLRRLMQKKKDGLHDI